MVDMNRARNVLQGHFESVSPEEFEENQQAFDAEASGSIAELEIEPSRHQLALFQTPAPLPLNAYLASALSGLDDTQRDLLFFVSDTVSQVCERHRISVYEPRKKTDPVHHPSVSDTSVFAVDRERVLESDLLILLCHHPSMGAGEELSFAVSALLPILMIYPNKTKVSRMVTGIPAYKVELTYDEPEELRARLDVLLGTIRPILEERKIAFADYRLNLVGERIRRLRESQGLTREDVCDATPMITLEMLKQLEDYPDNVSDPTLTQLRQLAVILKTTAADLIEPDLDERVVATFSDWLEGKVSARYPGRSDRDRRALMRRLSYRIMDSLEEDQT